MLLIRSKKKEWHGRKQRYNRYTGKGAASERGCETTEQEVDKWEVNRPKVAGEKSRSPKPRFGKRNEEEREGHGERKGSSRRF